MPSETLQGVVLRYANYRERDRMLSVLTPDQGRIDVLSRGCRRPTSPLLAGSELFVHGEFVVFRSGERYTLTSCTLTDAFYPLRLEPYRLTCATYLLHLAQAAAQPQQPAQGLYALLLEGLYHLAYCTQEAPLSVVNAFLLRYAAELGYRPRMNHCVHCHKELPQQQGAWLDVEAGGLCCESCAKGNAYPLSASQTRWMRDALTRGLESELSEPDAPLFEALRRYVESRLEVQIRSSVFLP